MKDAVSEYLYALGNTSKHTRRTARTILTQFADWCQGQNVALEQLKPSVLRRYVEFLRSDARASTARYSTPLSNQTIHIYVCRIKAMLRWLQKEPEFENLVTESTIRRIEVPRPDTKIIEVFTPEQFNKLYAACSNEPYAGLEQRDHAILNLLIDTGIRAQELCNLTIEDIYFDDGFIRVVNGKGRKSREVGFGKRTRSTLRTYINRYRKVDASERHVFLSKSKEPLTPDGLNDMLERLERWSGISGVRCSAHTFRHTFAVNALKQGLDVYKLSRRLGHTNINTTTRYLQAFQAKDARQGVSVLDGFK